MSKLTSAYLAGLVDGEGSISFILRKEPKWSAGIYYQPRLRIAMIDKAIIDWLQSSFGGYISERKFENPKYNTAYCWEVSSTRCENVLRAIYPYLRIKKPQCDVAFKKFNFKKSGNYRWTPEEMEYLASLHQEMKRLNKRGKI